MNREIFVFFLFWYNIVFTSMQKSSNVNLSMQKINANTAMEICRSHFKRALIGYQVAIEGTTTWTSKTFLASVKKSFVVFLWLTSTL